MKWDVPVWRGCSVRGWTRASWHSGENVPGTQQDTARWVLRDSLRNHCNHRLNLWGQFVRFDGHFKWCVSPHGTTLLAYHYTCGPDKNCDYCSIWFHIYPKLVAQVWTGDWMLRGLPLCVRVILSVGDVLGQFCWMGKWSR